MDIESPTIPFDFLQFLQMNSIALEYFQNDDFGNDVRTGRNLSLREQWKKQHKLFFTQFKTVAK
jgi:hypothetical protein